MRKIFLLLIILVTAISCGRKKRVVTAQGDTLLGVLQAHYQYYSYNDSVFKIFSDKDGLIEILSATSDSAFNDSTYSETKFMPGNKLYTTGNYKNKKRDGLFRYYFLSGKLRANVFYSNGIENTFEGFYESGKPRQKGELINDSTFRDQEYSQNGLLLEEMITDKTGKGSSTVYDENGKIKESGSVLDYNPSGIWKIYDTLGKPVRDTFFIAEGPLKMK